MERVTGIGGIFFKAQDPVKLRNWYRDHLGVDVSEHGSAQFRWIEPHRAEDPGSTVWATFSAETRYFEPSKATFMINYRVADLHAMLAQLRREGVQVDDKTEESEYGKFGWVVDPEGNKLELWEPPAGS